MNYNIWAIIPARYASKRLPGKPLREIAGKPLIWWAWRAATNSGLFNKVIIATDDERIAKTSESFGADYTMTNPEHASGTDRIAEVIISTLPSSRPSVVLNIQGDEPLLTPGILEQFVPKFIESGKPMGTIITPARMDEIEDPATVKVITDSNNDALYFSRARIPFDRDGMGRVIYYKHIGIYAFQTPALIEFSKMKPSKLETIEKLEQLRAIENGWKISCVEITEATNLIGVDTESDLKRAEKVILRGNIE
ncbi:3-deoxy-manno-octulosonate cytidylyltransferase [bacterium]|nr:3-deoxy-manno-octulosonate cytidylyltransferase [bacterium]